MSCVVSRLSGPCDGGARHPKKGHSELRARSQVKYAFIKEHRPQFSVRAMCRVLKVHHSGFYAWLKSPLCRRAQDDRRITELITRAWQTSGRVYGYRKIHDDLRDLGETCCPNRVARLARAAGIKAQIGYRRRPRTYGGKPAVVADNRLGQVFDSISPDQVWVTDITYIRTHEGWLYLAVIIDLYARHVVGWSMQSRMHMDLVLNAMLVAVWRRKPTQTVIVHSDQGSQFTSYEWQKFFKTHNLEPSMSRRGNCYDNAVAESFFQLLKRERIRRKTFTTRKKARADVFDYIEFFYNPKNARMVSTECCRLSTLRDNKIGSPRVSKKLGAIQIDNDTGSSSTYLSTCYQWVRLFLAKVKNHASQKRQQIQQNLRPISRTN